MKSGPLKLTIQFIQAFAFADQNLSVPVLLICPLALSRVKSFFLNLYLPLYNILQNNQK